MVFREEDEEETRVKAVIVAWVADVLSEKVRTACANLPEDVNGIGGG